MSEKDEGSQLRAMWEQLSKDHDELAREGKRLHGTKDTSAFQEHGERLRVHAEALRSFAKRLDNFHTRYGHALGMMDADAVEPSADE